MDLRALSQTYLTTPQLEPSELAKLAEQGVGLIICNRPDAEVPDTLRAAQLQLAAEAAGISFVYNPVTVGAMTMDNVEEQAEAIASAEGVVVAYCASGMRSAVMWAYAMAGQIDTDEIIRAAEAAGFQMAGQRAQIDALAAAQG